MIQIQKRAVAAVLAIAVIGMIPSPSLYGKTTGSDLAESPAKRAQENLFVQGSSLIGRAPHYIQQEIKVPSRVIVTAYSSTPEQTDDTPFITAAGTSVREGIIAANFLPFGTKVKLPDLYGDKVFVVEDRMHPRKVYQVDIWFPTYSEAKNFGAQSSAVEVVEG